LGRAKILPVSRFLPFSTRAFSCLWLAALSLPGAGIAADTSGAPVGDGAGRPGSALLGSALDPFLDLKTPLAELLKTESSQNAKAPSAPTAPPGHPGPGSKPHGGIPAPPHASGGDTHGHSNTPEAVHGKTGGGGASPVETKKERLERLVKGLNRFRGLLELEQAGQMRYDNQAETVVVPMALRVDQRAYKRAAVQLADLLEDIGRSQPPVLIQSTGAAADAPASERPGFFSNLPLSMRVIERLNPKPVAGWEGRLARGRLWELDPLRKNPETDAPLTVLLCTGIDPEHRTLKLTPYALDFVLPEAVKRELRRGYFVSASIHNPTGEHLARARVNLAVLQPQSTQPFPWIVAVYDKYLVVAPYLIHHFGWPGDGYYFGAEFSALFRFAPERWTEVQSAKVRIEEGDLPKP
jgi:hypothetical protein